jgi:para-nitrobenzyl esterase
LAAITLLFTSACSSQGTEPAEAITGSAAARVVAGGEILQGELLDPKTGLLVFRGIPFAVPPTGNRRWRPPEPHIARQGVQDAGKFGPACPQLQGNPEFYRYVAERYGASADVVPPMRNISEDCLYLNVWTKLAHAGKKRPVMVWIYGGGNSNGYAQEPEYLGDAFAMRDVVYLSLNYRLGALGFLAHQGLSAESAEGVSGNYGILDQIAALQWVKENIAAFGGDPENITVFGESAGAANIATLIASPLATGLFQHAISQSGGYPVDVFYTLEEAEQIGSQIALHLEVENSENPGESIEALRALDWQTIVQGAVDAGAGAYSAVNIDGWLLPDALASLYQSGRLNPVDLMIGANKNEDYPWIKEGATADDLSKSLERFDSPYREQFTKLLEPGPNTNARVLMDRLDSAADFLCPSLFVANMAVRHGLPVYFYYFTRVRPGGERLLAYHGAEISYPHNSAYEWMPADETDRSLTETMGRYWVSFASTGSPNGDGLPHWPPYTESSGDYQELGDTVKTGSGLESDICRIFDRIREDKMSGVLR